MLTILAIVLFIATLAAGVQIARHFRLWPLPVACLVTYLAAVAEYGVLRYTDLAVTKGVAQFIALSAVFLGIFHKVAGKALAGIWGDAKKKMASGMEKGFRYLFLGLAGIAAFKVLSVAGFLPVIALLGVIGWGFSYFWRTGKSIVKDFLP